MTEQPSEIRADCIYTLDEFKRRTGLGKTSLRNMRRNGLIERSIGRCSYIYGRDFIDWYQRHAEQVA